MSREATAEARQYLAFTLDQELFALEIAKVREVLEFTSITRVPRTPGYLRGVINLRGNVVPVVDLRVKFGLPPTARGADACAVIVEVAVDGELTVLGVLADSVQEVIDLEPSQIDPPPRMGIRLDTSFIRGMGKRDGHFVILLDIERVLSPEELGRAAEAAAGCAAGC